MKYSTLTAKNLKYIRNMSRGNSLLRWANITIGGSDYVKDTLATVKITSICNFEKLDGIVAYEYEVYVHDMDGRCWDDALTFKVKVDEFKSTRAASLYVKEKVLEIFKNREAEISEEEEEEAEEIHVIDFEGFQTINEYSSKYKNNASIFPSGNSETILPLMQNNGKKWLPKYLKQICEFTEEKEFAFDFEKRDFKTDWNSFRIETNEMQFVILQLKNVSYENINNESTSYLWSEKGYLLIIKKANDRYSFESHYLPAKGIYSYERYEKSSRPRTINQMLKKFGKVYSIDFWMKEII